MGDNGQIRGDTSNTAAGSGLTGSQGYGTTTATGGYETGAGSGLRGDSTSHTADLGSGTGLTGTGATAAAGGNQTEEQYVEGSEQHHRGDGHPEDILHPGPHVTGTAKALDPHIE